MCSCSSLGTLGNCLCHRCMEGSKACSRHFLLSSWPPSLVAVSDALSWLGNSPCHWSAHPSEKRVYSLGGKLLLLALHYRLSSILCQILCVTLWQKGACTVSPPAASFSFYCHFQVLALNPALCTVFDSSFSLLPMGKPSWSALTHPAALFEV